MHMIVRTNPLTRPLLRELVALADITWDPSALDRCRSDQSRTWTGDGNIDLGGGHTLEGSYLGSPRIPTADVWVTFCYAVDEEMDDDNFDHLPNPPWIDVSSDPGAFDIAWEQARTLVAAEFGPPAQITQHTFDDRPLHVAAWRFGSAVMLIAQNNELPYSQGDGVHHVALWLLGHDPDAPLPDASGIYKWINE